VSVATAALGDLLEEIRTGPFGSALHADEYEPGGVPVVNPQHYRDGRIEPELEVAVSRAVADRMAAFALRAGDVVVARRGEMGRCAVVRAAEEGWILGTGSAALRPKPQLDSSFLAYFLRSPAPRRALTTASVGTTMANLNQKILRELECPAPPFAEQRAIVAAIETHFSRLDAAVASLNRAKANVKRARASVLQAAVEGRLVPTEAALARAEGRDYEPASALLARILEERKAARQESGKRQKLCVSELPEPLPPIPEGWCWATLPQLGEMDRGKSRHRPRNDARLLGGPYPFIQTSDVRRSGGFIREHSATYSEFGLAQSRLWPVGTLCITIAANIAETGILTFEACFPDSVVGFLPWLGPIGARLVELFLRTKRAHLAELAPATAQKNINLDTLRSIAVPLPALAEQHRIVAEVDRRLSVLDALDATLDTNLARCVSLRQSILQRAFSGRLVVAELTRPAAVEASVAIT
jgi:type I restriction enzyme S subunit